MDREIVFYKKVARYLVVGLLVKLFEASVMKQSMLLPYRYDDACSSGVCKDKAAFL